jgi:hypothetical protein
MNLAEIVPASSSAELPHSLDERSTFNITHCTTQFNDADIWLFTCVIDGQPRRAFDPVLDSICDVRHHLNCLAQIVASALSLDNVLIDLSRRDAVFSSEGNVEVSGGT